MQAVSSKKATGHRRAMIAKVHIAYRDARVCNRCGGVLFEEFCPGCGGDTHGMSEMEYRGFLRRLTGKTSCRDLTEGELHRVLTAFRQYGFVPSRQMSLRQRHEKALQGMRKAVRDKAEEVLGENWKGRLRGFLRRQFGVDDIEFVRDMKALRQVWGFLRAVEKEPF